MFKNMPLFAIEYREEASREGGVPLNQGFYETALLEVKNHGGKRSRKTGDKVDKWLDGFYMTARGTETRNTKNSKIVTLAIKQPSTIEKLHDFNLKVSLLPQDKIELCINYYSQYTRSVKSVADELNVTPQNIDRMKKKVREISLNCFSSSRVNI